MPTHPAPQNRHNQAPSLREEIKLLNHLASRVMYLEGAKAPPSVSTGAMDALEQAALVGTCRTLLFKTVRDNSESIRRMLNSYAELVNPNTFVVGLQASESIRHNVSDQEVRTWLAYRLRSLWNSPEFVQAYLTHALNRQVSSGEAASVQQAVVQGVFNNRVPGSDRSFSGAWTSALSGLTQ